MARTRRLIATNGTRIPTREEYEATFLKRMPTLYIEIDGMKRKYTGPKAREDIDNVCGLAMDSGGEQGQDEEDYYTGDEENEEGGYAQSTQVSSKKHTKYHTDSQGDYHEDEDAHHNHHRKQTSQPDVSDLSNSQGAASKSTSSRHQSGSNRRQSSTARSKKGKKSRTEHEQTVPGPAGEPLDESSHSARDRHRLEQANRNMPPADSTRKKKSSSNGGSSIGGKSRSEQKRSGKERRKSDKSKKQQEEQLMDRELSTDEEEDEDEYSHDSTADSSQSPSKKEFQKYTRKQMEKEYYRMQKALRGQSEPTTAKAPPPASVSLGGSDASPDKKFAYSEGGEFKMGDPSNEKDNMWIALYNCMLYEVYRLVKFINEQEQKELLCNLVMDKLGHPALTLTGNAKKNR